VLQPLLDASRPAAGAIVMGTGIVSLALLLDKRRILSDILLVLDATVWLALALAVPARAKLDRQRFLVDLRHAPALTAIAGTGVLGTRIAAQGWSWAGVALLVIAFVLWLGLIPQVLRHWTPPTLGVSFMLTVSTQSVSLLAATVGLKSRTTWLLYAALVLFVLGLVAYLFVLRHFQWRQLISGSGDQWVTGGALAISTVAAARIALLAGETGQLGGKNGPLQTLSLVLWCLAMAWLPCLLVSEATHPRLTYAVNRWATVFPFGMYAACSFAIGSLCDIHGINVFARVWVWVALAVWALVGAAMARRAPQLTGGRSARRSVPPTQPAPPH
jgi:tellurite resistance protein TehA-like permease